MKTMGRNFAPKMGHSKKEEEKKRLEKKGKRKEPQKP